MRTIVALGATLALIGVAQDARAHITFESNQAVAGATIRAVLRVPHGCEGSPTVRIRIQIPEGVTGVRPQPKPGWELSIVRGPAAQPAGHGAAPGGEVRELAWSGGRLPDEHYDEFVFRATLPDRPGVTLNFPVVQDCERGGHRWIEIPAEGRSRDDAREPAPAIRLTPRP